MKILFKITAILLLFILFNCKEEVEKPKLTYTKNEPKVAEQKQDTTKISVAGLPIQFELTNYLIHPIGNINYISNTTSKTYDSSSDENISFNIANNLDHEITGFLQNLKFQKINSDSLISLTTKPMLIQSVNYLTTIALKTKQQTLAYLLADADTNNDGKLDTSDIKSLYLSDISGTKFTKISTDVQEVLDWKILDSKNRLYFRAVEDTNKNGKFDKNDKIHYNYVNLLEKEWKAIEFMPI